MDVPSIEKPAKIEVLADNIPAEIKQLHRWVTWDWIWSTKQEKWTKPPLQANKMPASSTDAKTWTRFDIANMLGRNRAGVGFMLGADVGVVGIDLDKCRDPATGTIKPLQAELIRQLNTYAEVSPSGTGVKLLCRGVLPEKCRKANHELGIEIYCDKRYFTITGHVLDNAPRQINQCQAQIDDLLNRFMTGSQDDLPRPELASEEDEIELAKSALQSLDGSLADGYTDWLMIGMALHAISPYLLDDWDRWSRGSSKYASGECARKWASFDGQGVGPGTLYHFAKIRGWTPPRGWKKSKVKRSVNAIENYHKEIIEGKDGTERLVKIPHSQPQIVASVFDLFENWPKRIGSQLFVCDGEEIEYLPKPSSLFSWMQEKKSVIWGNGDELISKEELFISICRRAEEFADVQAHPHFPPIDDVFYTAKVPKPGDGSHLETMLDFFSPASKEDRQLIKAAIATTFWGGPPGQRPAFLISAAHGSGQGTGKSTLAGMVGRLTGGALDISTGMDAEEIKRRFLSGNDKAKRVVFLDNVKKTKFSDQGVEALLTSLEISGHGMYVGSCSRPNLMTWFITMNGPSLSRDLAQRCINIMLRKPKHSGNWFEEATNFIIKNREKIVGDIAAFFNRERKPISYPSRWGLWEREVMSRLDDHESVMAEVRSRESINDDDYQSAKTVEDYVNDKLKDAGYDHPMRVHIGNERLAQWIDLALGDDEGRRKGWRHSLATLTRLESAGLLLSLSKNPSRKHGRGWIFSTANDDAQIRYDLETKII